ncbi:hypothetical protein [Shimia sp. MIT1388]|uniref:hypothetical protein n=1 Tax=Shimia sp. MIT1388 TaxID=3096992 RepID=UPI00399AA287
MFYRLALPVTLLSLVTLTACGNPQTTSDRSVRAGPQAQSPVTPGPNNRTPSRGYTSTVPANAVVTCPQGATLVTTPSGVTSCAHTTATNLSVGDETAFDTARLETMQAQATATGLPVAYTDGVVTTTIYPATRP